MDSQSKKRVDVVKLAGIGMLSGIAFILMFFEFPIPVLIPSFIKLDLSDLPALIGAFAYGPIAGILIELIKNLLHLLDSSSGFVGELSNFLLGACFVGVAGCVYKLKKSKSAAIIGATVGACAMAVFSLVTNYFIVYPFYTNFMPMDAIIAAYKAIIPSVDNLFECLLIFNVPFTFVKGMISVVITVLIYKPISPLLHGRIKKN
ncbi:MULTISPECIES: ECF transporter S component [Lachnospira]|jgi:riboflavin transporter FmnP|uniref:ECF transporter S component n=1 Tax=Lachnospira TaxID=28050 RepID=UPI0004289459|nr:MULTISPECIES: ECF transporter S component [Lachnospira]MBQ2473411.1 ECF transporter S component [Lachnospira sp.]